MEAYSHCVHCQAVLWRSHVKFEQLRLRNYNSELDSSEREPIWLLGSQLLLHNSILDIQYLLKYLQ
jgi:hypothetical protein